MGGHHLILGKLSDLLTGEVLDDTLDERYRQAARTFSAWRADGTLRKDPRPSLYVYEQTYTVPGSSVVRVQRGETLALANCTLGTADDVQRLSGLLEGVGELLRGAGALGPTHGKEPVQVGVLEAEDIDSDDGFLARIDLSLAPGGSIQIGAFPPCTLYTGGTWTVRCSAYVLGDGVPANDFFDSTFTVEGGGPPPPGSGSWPARCGWTSLPTPRWKPPWPSTSQGAPAARCRSCGWRRCRRRMSRNGRAG